MKPIVIIPTLRERDNLRNLLPLLVSQADVLVVDDHSNDGSREVVERFSRAHFLERTQNPGYGRSILDGFRWALDHGYDRVVTMDADFSHDPSLLPNFFSGDVVIGSRYVSGGRITNWKWHRRILSLFANWYVRSVLSLSIRDFTTGYVGYTGAAIQLLANRSPAGDGYAFLVSCKYILASSGFAITEFPITYTERREGQSKMSWRIMWESVWLPWRLRFAKLKR